MAETEEVLKLLINKFNNVCKRRGLKINVDKSKVMIVGGGNENRCEVDLNGKMLEVVKEFGYLGSIVNDKGTDESDCNKRVVNGRKTAGMIRSLVNKRCLSQNCAKILHEKMLVPTLLYGSECMVWKPKERWKIQAVQMDNLRGMLGVKRVDKMKNEEIRRKFGIEKGVNELINESVLRWFGHMERMPSERLVKRIYESEGMGDCKVGRPPRKWIKNVREVLEGMNVGMDRAKRIVRDRNAWRGLVRGRTWGVEPA